MYGTTPCGICGDVIAEGQDTLCFLMYDQWENIDGRSGEYPFNDGCVHSECMKSWPKRDAFVQFFNENCRNELRVDKHGVVYYRTDWSEVLVTALLMTLFGPILLLLIAAIPTLVGYAAFHFFGAVVGWISAIVLAAVALFVVSHQSSQPTSESMLTAFRIVIRYIAAGLSVTGGWWVSKSVGFEIGLLSAVASWFLFNTWSSYRSSKH